ncbi:MAG: ribonuclease domain-containing protein [Gallionella sp.]
MLYVLRLMLVLLMLAVTNAQAFQWPSHHHENTQNQNTDGTISVAELPDQARDVLRAIKQGGPFAFDRDGVMFGNYEHALPKQPRGYYHEYTVKTPGAHNRGARRIISGDKDEYYYTDDHYQTFKRIRE